ncbi:MAG: RNA-binding S4 domain-containing protein [Methylophilaceae bacterium]|nr:RNA-binding S4 domain-containing protein [Methylophilaceae bacterium]
MADAEKVRLDKWLWAARFFKTRALSAEAVESGKVQMDGARVKPAKEVKPGQVLRIRRGAEELEVVVRGLSTQRRGAPEAALLYEETEASRQRRENARLTGEHEHARRERGMGRPTKRDRRMIQKFFG